MPSDDTEECIGKKQCKLWPSKVHWRNTRLLQKVQYLKKKSEDLLKLLWLKQALRTDNNTERKKNLYFILFTHVFLISWKKVQAYLHDIQDYFEYIRFYTHISRDRTLRNFRFPDIVCSACNVHRLEPWLLINQCIGNTVATAFSLYR